MEEKKKYIYIYIYIYTRQTNHDEEKGSHTVFGDYVSFLIVINGSLESKNKEVQ